MKTTRLFSVLVVIMLSIGIMALGLTGCKSGSSKKNSGDTSGSSDVETSVPEATVDEVTDFEIESFGTFTGTLTDGVPTGTGKVVTEEYTYESTFTSGAEITGTGVLTYANGESAEGTFTAAKLNGAGSYDYGNGCTYEGQFVDGVFEGEGTFSWTDGSYLEGTFENGQPTTGKKYFPDGCVYEGQFENFEYKGQGKFTWMPGNDCWYVGEFNNGWINGQGEFHWGNSGVENYWIGNFVDGNPERGAYGYARCDGVLGYIYINPENGGWIWYNGTLEDGTIVKDGQPLGEEFTGLVNGLIVIDGKYANGEITFTYDDGTVYVGNATNGSREGSGKLTYTNGCYYEGAWANNAYNGEGKFFWPGGDTGDTLTGTFANGAPASGVKTFNNGDKYEGTFNSSWNFDGTGKFTYANNMYYEGKYVNGKRIDDAGYFDWNNGCWYRGAFIGDAMTGAGEFHWGKTGTENYWKGEFVNEQPKKGTYGYGRMDGAEGYIWVDATSGAWSWYNGTLEDGTVVSNGQACAADFTGLVNGLIVIDGKYANGEITFTYDDGTVYAGNATNGSREGSGKLTYTNGCYYEGAWANNAYNGEGKFFWPGGDTGDTLTGTFANGAPASGVKTFNNGDKYEGTFNSSWNFDGTGKFTYANNMYYEGKYVNGKRIDDDGYFDWNNGCWYRGAFIGDAMTGAGEFHWGKTGTENYWKGQFENQSPKKGTYGYGRMDGTEGYIWVDATSGAWSWYNGTLDDGTVISNGQKVEE